MGLLDFAKSLGAKIRGMAGTAPSPPAEPKEYPWNRQLKEPEVEAKTDEDKVIPSSSAPVEEVRDIAPAADESPGVAPDESHVVSSAEAESASLAADESHTESAANAPEAKFYTVQPGDTLWKIAEAEYGAGHGAKYQLIFDANKPVLSEPDKILPGQVLRIPPLEE
jgi:nucleoid-associated protein YgaU